MDTNLQYYIGMCITCNYFYTGSLGRGVRGCLWDWERVSAVCYMAVLWKIVGLGLNTQDPIHICTCLQ